MFSQKKIIRHSRLPSAALLSLTSLGLAASSTQQEPQHRTPFPSSADTIPQGWHGKVFRLSQDYPTALPAARSPSPWEAIDFKADGAGYLRAVLNYLLEGNREVDWVIQNNRVRTWYHAPWMHYGNGGREFINGLTRERSSRPGELHPKQTSTFQNWAVGMYNDLGGYTIGQVWDDPTNPNASKAKFPIGTVSAKLLYTEANESEVPYIRGAPEVTGNILSSLNSQHREPKILRLLQVDVAVRDARAVETGWVFGTFVYQSDAPGKTGWDRLMPVGVMWGNDPQQIVDPKSKIRESWINPEVQLPHYGFAGRLNGPVDNPRSSCLSCHATGQVPVVEKMAPQNNADQAELLKYFRNLLAGEPFQSGATSTDYSLQLSIGIDNFLSSRKNKSP